MSRHSAANTRKGRLGAAGAGANGIWARPFRPPRLRSGSGSLGGVVLLGHARGDTPTIADRDALVLRPGPDVRAALTAGRGPPRPAPRPPPGPARVLDERRELPAERRGVLSAQVDLVVGAAEPEPHRLIRRASINVVFQRDGYLLSHPRPPLLRSVSCTVQDQCYSAVTATPFRGRSFRQMNISGIGPRPLIHVPTAIRSSPAPRQRPARNVVSAADLWTAGGEHGRQPDDSFPVPGPAWRGGAARRAAQPGRGAAGAADRQAAEGRATVGDPSRPAAPGGADGQPHRRLPPWCPGICQRSRRGLPAVGPRPR